MLRGIRKASSNWLGKIVMAIVMGVLIVSFAVWGIADIFKGFGQSSLAKIGKHRDFDRAIPPDLHRQAAAARPQFRPSADLGTGPRLRARPAGAAADHRRSRAGRGSAAHGARPVAGRNHAADLQRSQFQGIGRQVRSRTLPGHDPAVRLHRAALSRRAAARRAAAPDRRHRLGRRRAAEGADRRA